MKTMLGEYSLMLIYIIGAVLLFAAYVKFGDYRSVADGMVAQISGTSYQDVKDAKDLIKEKGWEIDPERW